MIPEFKALTRCQKVQTIIFYCCSSPGWWLSGFCDFFVEGLGTCHWLPPSLSQYEHPRYRNCCAGSCYKNVNLKVSCLQTVVLSCSRFLLQKEKGWLIETVCVYIRPIGLDRVPADVVSIGSSEAADNKTFYRGYQPWGRHEGQEWWIYFDIFKDHTVFKCCTRETKV